MSTSAINDYRVSYLKTAKRDLLIAAGAALAGAIYEHFSFGVYSNYMIYAFLPLLLLGALPFLVLGTREKSPALPRTARLLWHAGIAALTVGSLFRGVLEIYGTESPLIPVYWAAGGGLLTAGAVTALIGGIRMKRIRRNF